MTTKKVVYDIALVMPIQDDISSPGAFMLKESYDNLKEALAKFKELAKEPGRGEKGFILEKATLAHETIERIAIIDYEYKGYKTLNEFFDKRTKIIKDYIDDKITYDEFRDEQLKNMPTLKINKKYLK